MKGLDIRFDISRNLVLISWRVELINFPPSQVTHFYFLVQDLAMLLIKYFWFSLIVWRSNWIKPVRNVTYYIQMTDIFRFYLFKTKILKKEHVIPSQLDSKFLFWSHGCISILKIESTYQRYDKIPFCIDRTFPVSHLYYDTCNDCTN